MQSYDVIIVGAGPAGLNCANHLKDSGKSILLIDKKEIIGPKICAGGLTAKDIVYFNIPENLIDHKFNQFSLKTSSGKNILKFSKHFVNTIDRKNFGQWQLSKLKNSNIEIKTNTNVTKIDKNYIEIDNKKKIKYKYLVGADGSSSLTRRYLGISTKKLAVCIQYIIPTDKYKDLEIFFDSKLFHAWYAWIFPHQGYVSIGTGCNPKYVTVKQLKENFHKWLKEKNIDYSKGEYQAHPINYDYQGFYFKNIFLIGEAAGFTSGLTGEGIYPALISGEEVAKKILNNNHNCDKINKFLKNKKIQEFTLKIFEISGPFKNFEFNLMNLILTNKKLRKKLGNIYA
ncbi:MAG: NAD(P)/FAD-dependent oxidoreductase [Patescibacteria group bacterium]